MNRKFRWQPIRPRIGPLFYKFMIGNVCLGVVRPSLTTHHAYNWHCSLPGIKATVMYGETPSLECARERLHGTVINWFNEVDI